MLLKRLLIAVAGEALPDASLLAFSGMKAKKAFFHTVLSAALCFTGLTAALAAAAYYAYMQGMPFVAVAAAAAVLCLSGALYCAKKSREALREAALVAGEMKPFSRLGESAAALAETLGAGRQSPAKSALEHERDALLAAFLEGMLHGAPACGDEDGEAAVDTVTYPAASTTNLRQ